MKCNDIHNKLSQYFDGYTDEEERVAVESHLLECPLCRSYSEELLSLKTGLRNLNRPELSLSATDRIKVAVREDIRGNGHGTLHGAREWIQMSLMPMSVGVAATLVIGVTFLALMFNAAGDTAMSANADGGPDGATMIAANRGHFASLSSRELSPFEYARTRTEFAGESPSINPQGALVTLSHELINDRPKSDEVVVVADVFSNGLAQIAEVVEPARNSRVLYDLQRAMDGDLGETPFVPAVLDNRSDSVRVVLKFQTVNVSARTTRRKK